MKKRSYRTIYEMMRAYGESESSIRIMKAAARRRQRVAREIYGNLLRQKVVHPDDRPKILAIICLSIPDVGDQS